MPGPKKKDWVVRRSLKAPHSIQVIRPVPKQYLYLLSHLTGPCFCKTGSHYVAKASLELGILLPQPPWFWDHRHLLSCPAWTLFRMHYFSIYPPPAQSLNYKLRMRMSETLNDQSKVTELKPSRQSSKHLAFRLCLLTMGMCHALFTVFMAEREKLTMVTSHLSHISLTNGIWDGGGLCLA